MPTIIFTDDPKATSEAVRANGWRKGSVADLSVDSCERWIRRGCAKYHQPEARPAGAVAPAAEMYGEPDEGGTLPFDPSKASIEVVREFLAQHNVRPGPRVSEAKLRETVREILAR